MNRLQRYKNRHSHKKYTLTFVKKEKRMEFNTLKVKQVRRLTDKAVAVSFEIPKELKKKYAFKAGQYATVEHQHQGEVIRRSYSICAAPSEGKLVMGVKEIHQGKFSVYANRELSAGDALMVSTPEGRFAFENNRWRSKNILCIAAGSGITPIMSIAKEALSNHNSNTVYLLYGNQSEADEMFAEELDQLLAAYPERLKLFRTYSRAASDKGAFGRIDNALCLHTLKNAFGQPKLDLAYLCGPEGMIETLKESLQKYGMPQDKILYELFYSEKEEVSSSLEGQVLIDVLIDGVTHSINAAADKLVLDSLLENDLDAPYSCQGGVCSSCICKVKKGAVEMVKNQILTDSEIAQGLTLACQAKITEAPLSIDFDDV